MCLYPKLIKNPKYKPNKKNGGTPPVMRDDRTAYVPIGCGKCMECMKQRARNWQVRLQEEIKDDKRGQFITFTFSNEWFNELSIEVERIRRSTIEQINEMSNKPFSKKFKKIKGYDLDNAIATLAVRRFLERWRKKHKKSVKHWLVTELGQTNTERIHIHGLLWSSKSMEEIDKIWKYGHVWLGDYVNEATVNYVVKYIYKTDEIHKLYEPIILTSSGIGKGYLLRNDSKLNRYAGTNTDETYKTRQGIKLPLPIYYRNKLYSEDERENLWINLLDKEERWVNGKRCDVSENYTDYEKLLTQERRRNSRFGYGGEEIDEEKKLYERQIRELKHLQMKAKSSNIGLKGMIPFDPLK